MSVWKLLKVEKTMMVATRIPTEKMTAGIMVALS
jgi:hypothetical protein